ncbi:hypothetical protein PgNI_06397 [Pyricularia grisea]|uniref:Uncharacterized protein n=1 Tax=Pyricularia grisea TaxID=148305 RepID=A0A6P8B5C8_PYRGI|nr:hypothetical protein PgNI_06397 [Pyricularia grisea]TLD10546.1 hypothetical protein PgNI_06397 [Pyricularia grisea]
MVLFQLPEPLSCHWFSSFSWDHQQVASAPTVSKTHDWLGCCKAN